MTLNGRMVCKVVFKVHGNNVKCVCMDGLDDYYGHDPYFYDGKIARDVAAELERTLATLRSKYAAQDPSDSRPFQESLREDCTYHQSSAEEFREYLEAYERLIATAKEHPTAKLICI